MSFNFVIPEEIKNTNNNEKLKFFKKNFNFSIIAKESQLVNLIVSDTDSLK